MPPSSPPFAARDATRRRDTPRHAATRRDTPRHAEAARPRMDDHRAGPLRCEAPDSAIATVQDADDITSLIGILLLIGRARPRKDTRVTIETARLDELDRTRTTLAHLIADALADGRTPRPADVAAYRDVTAQYDQALGLAPLTYAGELA